MSSFRKKHSTSTQLDWVVFLIQTGADAEAFGIHFQSGYDNTCSGVTRNSSTSSDLFSVPPAAGSDCPESESISGQLNMSDLMSLQEKLYGHIILLHFIWCCLCNCAVFVYLCIRAGFIIDPMRLRLQANKIRANYWFYLMWFVLFTCFLYVHICGLLLNVFSLRLLCFLCNWPYGSCVSILLIKKWIYSYYHHISVKYLLLNYR